MVVVSILFKSCDYHHCPIPAYFMATKRNLCASAVTPSPPPPQYLATANLLPVFMDLSILDIL